MVFSIESTPKKHKGLSLQKLENLLSDIDRQPRWLYEAQKCADYYDSKQLDATVLQTMEERGMAPLQRNFIAPAINGVLGMEAKTRTDWIVRADNDDGMEVAEALNEKLNEAMRVGNANRACSDAYAAEVKTGLGWVEVNRESDPFEAPYRMNYVHRKEIYWDWHAKRPDLKDARYLIRHKWVDQDVAINAFPEHERIIKAAAGGWNNFLNTLRLDIDDMSTDLRHAFQEYENITLSEMEYFDYGRQRLKVFEVWYRVPQTATVMKLPQGRVMKFDKGNAFHRALVSTGEVELQTGRFPTMRMAYWIGPHRVMDIPSPLPHGNFPYIPFWGFREDGTGVPYGLIRSMISPQDEVNARLTKMMWLMTAKRVIMDEDATNMTLEQVLDEAHRADGVITLNKGRQNRDRDAFRIEQDFALTSQQFDVMKSAEEAIQSASGIYNAMLGRDADVQSGVAISSLIEQSSTTLAELNDNYRYARRMVGEHMLALIVQDMSKARRPEDVVVNADRPGQKTKHIILNNQVQDETGSVTINNDVARTKMTVVLDDITATAGYRAQISNRIFDMLSQVSDDLKGVLLPIALETTDVPQRDRMIEALNRAMGTNIDVENMTEEERAAYEQEQAVKAKQRELEMAEMENKVKEIGAKIRNLDAKSQAEEYDNRKTEAETEMVLQELEQLKQEMAQFRQEQLDRVDAEQAESEARSLLSQVQIEEAVA